jgi:hypothetical protein
MSVHHVQLTEEVGLSDVGEESVCAVLRALLTANVFWLQDEPLEIGMKSNLPLPTPVATPHDNDEQ